MATTKKGFYVRKFLNKPGHHTVASILVSVSPQDIKFALSDCDKTIQLEFSSFNKASRANSLHKAQVLIDTITEFKKALEAHFMKYPVDRERDY